MEEELMQAKTQFLTKGGISNNIAKQNMLFCKSLGERRCRSMVPSISEIYVLSGLYNLVSVMAKILLQ
jgi:hypothetical protein